MVMCDNKIRCDYRRCFAGGGVAGNLTCFLRGMWWHSLCPNFENEEEMLAEWEKERSNRGPWTGHIGE